MKNPNSHIKTIVILFVFVVLLFSAHYFLFREIRSKNEKVSMLEHDISLQDKRQDYLISTQHLIQDLSSDLADVDNSIITSGQDVGFIENLESAAKSNGLNLTIDSLVVKEDQSFAAANVSELVIKANTSGPWSGTYSFITELESLPFKVRINKLSLTSSPGEVGADGKTSGRSWQSNFEIVVLKYK